MLRPSTVPGLGGRDAARLAQLGQLVRRLTATLRFVDDARAAADAARLAARLDAALPAAQRHAASFHPIPRGGYVVLGLLAYHLDLPRERLRAADERDHETDAPLVLVDDCALSGLRLRQELERLPEGRPVVVAHLYSAPELRQAVLEAEPRVVACVAAGDLADRSREIFPDPEEHRAWRERWAERLQGERRYWLGLPELIAFPWNEPDRPFWNAATGRMEDGWRFVPPHLCTKNRARLAAALPPAVRREIAEGEPGGWRMADGVAWGEFDEVAWLVRTDSEQVFSLDGTAALTWRVLVVGGSLETAAAALARQYAVDEATARRDAEALAAELETAGLLERPG